MRQAAAAAGRDPDAVTICVAAPAYVGDDMAHMRDQCRWFGGMVGNHVADIVARYGDDGAVPQALTDYIAGRQGYDYNQHGRAGNTTDFVPDEIIDRFCILGPVEEHVRRLEELKALGVDQFAVYLQHDAKDGDAGGLRREGHPGGAVQEALQPDGDLVEWVDMTRAGRNPGRILPAVLTAFDDAHADQPVTMIGEPIWPGRNANEYAAALAHEALINVAFAGHDVTVVCPYDAGGLSAEALRDAHRTHPEIVDRMGARGSEAYVDPAAVVAETSARLSQPPPDAVALQLNRLDELRAGRQVLRGQAVAAGLTDDCVDRFVLAGHEAVANALQHGGGRAEVQIWREGRELVCQVHSPAGFGDLMAGRRRPPETAVGGRGLVMVNEICDLVQVAATPHGATIQMRTATTPL